MTNLWLCIISTDSRSHENRDIMLLIFFHYIIYGCQESDILDDKACLFQDLAGGTFFE